MSTFLNHNKPNRRPPPSHLLGRRSAAGSRGILNSRRVTGGGGGGSASSSTPYARPSTAAGAQRNTNVAADVGVGTTISDGGGQVQLTRTVQRAQPQQRGQQQGEGKQESLKEGQIDMDEVLHDIAILEQQQLDSERMLQSVKLARQQKLELKAALEAKLSKLKYENGAMRADLQRANKELSIRHRQLIESRSRCDNSRKEQNRFDLKLKRALGVARVLGPYQKQIESAMIALNETETRLNFVKGQSVNKLDAATLKRDDAKHRRDLLFKSIHSNQQKIRSVADDIVKIRAEIVGNEHDLSASQQMESQTKLRVETIEHEMNMEMTRHVDAIVMLERKAKEADDSKERALESIDEKKAMIEAKKEELGKIWAQCNDLRKSEGQDVLPLPKWGIDHAQSLDVSRIRVRVNLEEEELRVKKTERENLSVDIAKLEDVFETNESEASKIRADAEALLKATTEGRTVEDQRKEATEKAVHEAACECKEVEILRQSIEDLSTSQEKNAIELKQLVDNKDSSLSDLQKDIESTLAEFKSVENRAKAAESHQKAKQSQFSKELQTAKETKDIIENAFKLAQERAEVFAVQPDDELIAEMKQLDDDENAIIKDADREKDEVISREPFLKNIQYDHGSPFPLNDQAKKGMALLSKYCLEFIQEAQTERQIRVDKAKDEHFARKEEEKEVRRREEEEERLRIAEKEEREEKQRIAAAERERKQIEAKRRAAQEAAAEKRRIELEAEQKRLRDQATAKKREEDEARKRRDDREKQRKVEEDRRASERAAALERKEREKAAAKRRDEDNRRRAKAAEEKEKKNAAELQRKAREEADAKCREEEKKRRGEAELKRRTEEEAAKKRKERDLEAMRAKSREVQEKFRVEAELQKCGGRVADKTKLENSWIKKKRPYNPEEDEDDWNTAAEGDFHFNKRLKDGASKREDANKSNSAKSDRRTKSYSKSDALALKSKTLKPEKKKDKRDTNEFDEERRKQSRHAEKSTFHDASKRDSSNTQRSLPSQSAIRTKDSKRSKSTSGVTFDQSVTRPKLDIFSSSVHGKLKEKNGKSSTSVKSISSKPSSSQASGISSCEGAFRRRKKVSSKSKSSSLALCGFDDDAAFL
eukprot:CCRYP_003985-RA/>CCRYP_003985-RA protein AED:0.05 eAED:0.05 QI:123/1/1/1/1/1/9/250/1108